MSTSVRSRCKINLGLSIGRPRPDGFHELATLYQTLALDEIVTVEARPAARTSIELTCSHPLVPVDARNTAWRMAEGALAELRITAEVHIHIAKRLPVQGGLGAGSANAVAALLGLEHELGRRIPTAGRLRVAAAVGSDVPLFLLGGSVAGLGRGEEVYPLPDMASLPCVLALPEAGVSTPVAFRDWDRLHASTGAIEGGGGSSEAASPLTGSPSSGKLNKLSRSIAAAFGEPYSSGVFSQGEGRAETPLLALVRTGIENDFERVVFPRYPFLGDIKRILVGGSVAEDVAIYAALSGSGSALFGLYHSSKGAEAALGRLKDHGVAGLLTSTLPRDEYWRTILV